MTLNLHQTEKKPFPKQPAESGLVVEEKDPKHSHSRLRGQPERARKPSQSNARKFTIY